MASKAKRAPAADVKDPKDEKDAPETTSEVGPVAAPESEERAEFQAKVKDPERTEALTDPDSGQVIPPPPTVPDTSEADKALREVRDIHAQIREDRYYQDRVEVDETISGVYQGDDDSKDAHTGGVETPAVRIRAADRRLFIATSGEVVLDAQGVAELRRAVDKAFQAVA
jgi:hypothetical protein